MVLENIRYENDIELVEIPIQWIPKIELFYPDLPNFPTGYVHLKSNSQRIYGFPISVSFVLKDRNAIPKITFLCNKDLSKNPELKQLVKNELEERIGLSGKISKSDLISFCKGNRQYEKFFANLFDYMKISFGDFIPYGRFYEEHYSMVRFVSAWQPKTGRQSEMRMLYNFLSIFGEKIPVEGKWSFFDFFLIPTYSDIKNETLGDFSKYSLLYTTLQKIKPVYFKNYCTLEGETKKIHYMDKSWPQDRDSFRNKVILKLEEKNILKSNEGHSLGRLVDAFNRHGWRAAFYSWIILNTKDDDYNDWTKEYFTKFYLSKKGVGISEKVISCFVQQGFRNSEVIPVDTWIESFYKGALGIEEKKDFFNAFDNLGKIERVIWAVSQAKKTNIKTYFNMLWCIRYGDTGNNELRGANPIACYECLLAENCPHFNKIKPENVMLLDRSEARVVAFRNKNGREVGKELKSEKLSLAEKQNCKFVCILEEKVPKKIFVMKGKNGSWKLIDEFSGLLLSEQKLKSRSNIITVEEFVQNMPKFNFNEEVVDADD